MNENLMVMWSLLIPLILILIGQIIYFLMMRRYEKKRNKEFDNFNLNKKTYGN